jgi:hypothetical protein
VPGRLRNGSGDTFPVRNFAESLFKYRMLLNVASQVIERLPCLFQHAVEFSRALALPSASAICTRLWVFTSPSPGISIGRKIMSLNLLTTLD